MKLSSSKFNGQTILLREEQGDFRVHGLSHFEVVAIYGFSPPTIPKQV